MEIGNHTFIVTGGGSGLGAATCRLLAAFGAQVVVADIDETGAQALVASSDANIIFQRTDVTDEASVSDMLAIVQKTFGVIHGLVNCAGILIAERVLKKDGGVFPLELFRRGIDINLTGTFNALRLTSRYMQENQPNADGERGIVINTASIAAFEGQIGQACYSASKAGIVGLTVPIARELAPYGIRVMAIAPGFFDTPLLAALPDERRAALERQVPFPSRLGKPREFAELVKHIIENPMLNGSVIRLDGAVRMAEK